MHGRKKIASDCITSMTADQARNDAGIRWLCELQ
jgi:hypothetical protein